MGNWYSAPAISPLISLDDFLDGDVKQSTAVRESLVERSYAVFSLTSNEKIQSFLQLTNDVNDFFNETKDKKELLSSEGNVGYVETATREFLKLRSCDIPKCVDSIENFKGDNAFEALNHLADIGWRCFTSMNESAPNPLPEDELHDLKECLEERASLSVIHYFPATVSEADSFIDELPGVPDTCRHTPDSLKVCSQHRDTGIFTLILTSNVPGLEVFDLQLKSWIPLEKLIQPHINSPNTEIMVLMMGHKAPLFLGNRCQPTLHRVTVTKGTERNSFLYFMDTAKIN